MYLSLGLIVGGLLLIVPNPPVIVGTCLGFAAKGALAAREEEHLSALHGSEYERYCRGSWRFLPIGRRS
jgi:protein-S-isoprenylcysteine O-methyltransferase Ste14